MSASPPDEPELPVLEPLELPVVEPLPVEPAPLDELLPPPRPPLHAASKTSAAACCSFKNVSSVDREKFLAQPTRSGNPGWREQAGGARIFACSHPAARPFWS